MSLKTISPTEQLRHQQVELNEKLSRTRETTTAGCLNKEITIQNLLF